MDQLDTEFKFSKAMKNFIVLDSFIDDEPTEVMNELAGKISKWRNDSFFPQKQKLIDKLPDTEAIVYELLIAILGSFKTQAIQGLSVKLGKALGYGSIIEAVQIGSAILGECHGLLYDIALEPDGTLIKPKLKMDSKSRRKCQALCCLPPIKEKAPIWKSNRGGWLWDKQSVILGHGNHHWEYQALDALNKTQQIAWCIDEQVLDNEVNPNKAMNKAQFSEIAEMYRGEEFYFNWRYDKRGRMYCSGYDLHVQSNEYGKALLSPVKARVCDSRGMESLKIALAGHMGLDKLTWIERIDAVNLAYIKGELDDYDYKEPILGRKCYRAFKQALKGEPINHFMQLDATASFAQIAAALTNCVATGKLCNLVDTGNRENLYQHVADAMNAKLPNGERLGGAKVKAAVMCHTYNSLAEPRKAFNDTQLAVFYEVMVGLMPGAEALKELINNTWDSSTLEHSWMLPDGHVCKVPVTEMEDVTVRIDEIGGRRFTFRYDKNMPSKSFRSLAPNIIHSVDAYVNREMIRRCNFEIATIHE